MGKKKRSNLVRITNHNSIVQNISKIPGPLGLSTTKYDDPFYLKHINYRSSVAFPSVYETTNLGSQSAFLQLQQPLGLQQYPNYKQTTGQALPLPIKHLPPISQAEKVMELKETIGKNSPMHEYEREILRQLKKKIKKKLRKKKYEIKI